MGKKLQRWVSSLGEKDMKKRYCVNCGKELYSKFGIFCSKSCCMESSIQAISFRINSEEETIKKMFKKFKLVSQSDFTRRDKVNTSNKRIFYYALIKLLNVSSMSIERTLLIDHTTALHHVKKITEDEIKKAISFVENGTLDVLEEPKETEFEMNIKRLGFSYKTGINHAIDV